MRTIPKRPLIVIDVIKRTILADLIQLLLRLRVERPLAISVTDRFRYLVNSVFIHFDYFSHFAPFPVLIQIAIEHDSGITPYTLYFLAFFVFVAVFRIICRLAIFEDPAMPHDCQIIASHIVELILLQVCSALLTAELLMIYAAPANARLCFD